MSQYDGCIHCIPDINNQTAPLTTQHGFTQLENDTVEKHIVDKTRITRNLSQSYLFDIYRFSLEIERKTHVNDLKTGKPKIPTMIERNLVLHVKYCPVCGRNLSNKIPKNHPLINRKYNFQ